MREDNSYKTCLLSILKGATSVALLTALVSCGWFHPHSQGYRYQDQGNSRWGSERMESRSEQKSRDSGWTHGDMWGPGMMGPGHHQRMARHRSFMQSGIPSEYRGQINPLKRSAEVINEGAELYQQHCAGCHGPKGMGDGEAGKALNPSPALLAYMIQMPMSADEYLMWTVSEGGAQFGTAMPAYKEALPKESIWKIIAYMRAGFPVVIQHNNEMEP